MSDAQVTQEILDALIGRAKSLIWATELCIGPKRRRIDFWSISPHPGKAFRATSYEIKASRADFRRDTPEKQRLARLYSDEFYYVAPKGLLNPDDIPDWAGLQEWTGSSFRFTVHAPMRDKDAPSWELVTSILRYSGQTRRDTDMMKTQISALESQNKRLQERLGDLSNERLKLASEVNSLRRQIRTPE
jgi:hypothetical protein